MSRRIAIACITCLLAISFGASLWGQTKTPAPPAPAAAAPEKTPAAVPAAEKKPGVPEDPKKHTSVGLYVTPKEGYEMWQKDPDKVKILDVRTPEEYATVGHPAMAINIPVQFMTYVWNPEKKDYLWKDNPKFVARVKKAFRPTDTLVVMCRSGHRSAAAIEKLAKAGFKNLYNLHEGFEGDKVTDKSNPNFGKRMKNGWKNAGLPWTYELNPALIYLPHGLPKGKK